MVVVASAGRCLAGDVERGYQLLLEKPYLPADFDQETFDATWEVWPAPLRSEAARASPSRRREMAYRRYGIAARPEDPRGRPLQYVVGDDGQWTMNCFACHGGTVNGQALPGTPNRDFALETLTADIRRTKLRLGKPLTHMDLGSLVMPLGGSRGTTNAVMFGVALLAFRDTQLNLLPVRLPPRMHHHDMDAPAWWHFHKKRHIYIDGFAPKAHRPLMQFMLVEQNGPEQFREWEQDYGHVFAYLASLRAPRSPLAVDEALAHEGASVFAAHCAECHGTYDTHGPTEEYPGRLVPWEEVRTDPARLRALTPAHRQRYASSWFAEHYRDEVNVDPGGYVAPPLDGLWATAPYLHNGSVPTLWHLLHPDKRPVVWRRNCAEYDAQRVGLDVETWDQLPTTVKSADERREYFDTRQYGKSSTGHDFPARLTERQRRALLEYLKTL
jgi:mono/diheme cytochrome c family protein